MAFTMFRPQIRSRHPSHKVLRGKVFDLFPFRSVVRFGSTWTDTAKRVEINTVQSIRNASNKLVMKQLFAKKDVVSPKFILANEIKLDAFQLNYPVVAKLDFRSKGRGMVKIDSLEELKAFVTKYESKIPKYYLEEYFPSGREYRIHVSPHLKDEIFAVRKVITAKGKDIERWARNLIEGEVYFEADFEAPPIWDEMVKASIEACASVGLDVGACDVLYSVQKNTFSICEINSAPSMGENTAAAYIKAISNILKIKYDKM